MSSLHVDSVIKTFGTKQILTDIFLSCEIGEIVGILGRNGSGKSTLLKIIFGTMQAEQKFVSVGGSVLRSRFQSRNKIKYLNQKSFLPGQLKLETMLHLYCPCESLDVVKKIGFVKPLLNKKSKEMSVGERRIAEIILVIFSKANFILLDEPFNGVAPLVKEEIKNLIREQSVSKGFLLTDHDYRNIFDVSTKKILLFDGGTKVINTMEDLKHWGYLPGDE